MPLNENTPKCQAKAKTTGKPCRNDAMRYADYCRMHSGKPQQRARLQRLVDPVIDKIVSIMDDPGFEAMDLGERVEFVQRTFPVMKAVLEGTQTALPKQSEVTVLSDSAIDDEIRRLTDELEALDADA